MANLSETEVRQAFEYFDKDQSDSITHAELGDALRLAGMNPTDDDIQDLLKEADKDGSGKIEFSEFAKLMKGLENIDCKEELRKAFNHFDINGDGCISAEELQKRLDYSIDDAEEIIKAADLDDDGFINLEEFITMLSV
ncbi:calmodulin-like [Mizuhopecten yessoensis]|uniref:calmodulin-like n=1 Tax=Mizuhopecten yessoensis TaxID=6573 RepID=UPI000B45EAE4|nr:calmodulin-like [Mizuhopecten yessoensis]